MPRDITVTFDDGSSHVYKGAPEDATPDQVSERAAREFGRAVTALDGGRKAAKPTFGQMLKAEMLTSLPGGVVRGMKDVVDTGAQYLSRIGGDEARVKAMNDAGKAEFKAAQGLAGAGWSDIARVVGNIAGVAPITAAAGAGLGAAGAANLGRAVATGGMTGGGLLSRTAGGALSGGIGAGLVDPESAGAGAMIGAAAPGVLKAAGALGGRTADLVRGPQQSTDLAQAVKAARNAGYVIPPTQANGSLANRLTEGFAGKITTAQNASAQNADTFASAAVKDLGLPAGSKITPDVLDQVRKVAGQQYEAVKATGTVTPGAAYDAALDAIAAPFVSAQKGFPNAAPSPVLQMVESMRSPQFDAGSAVDMVRALRSQADEAFRAGSTDKGRAAKAGAKALEDALEDHLSKVGNPSDLAAFKEARKTIAKTYTVQKALNKETGHVDARKWANDLNKGKPLSGEIEKAARFASRFPKASQSVEGMGSLPQTSPLDWGLASLTSVGTGNILPMAGVLARPAARHYALSNFAQNRLVQPPPSSLSLSELSPLAYRLAPLLAIDR